MPIKHGFYLRKRSTTAVVGADARQAVAGMGRPGVMIELRSVNLGIFACSGIRKRLAIAAFKLEQPLR